jgi:hypothetical protein
VLNAQLVRDARQRRLFEHRFEKRAETRRAAVAEIAHVHVARLLDDVEDRDAPRLVSSRARAVVRPRSE